MVLLRQLLTALSLAFVVAPAAGHRQHHGLNPAKAALFQANAHRLLKECVNSPHIRKFKEQAILRRAAHVDKLRDEVAARRRLSASTVLATNHRSTLTGINQNTDAATLFGTDPKCVLEPGVTEGPYYVNGEFIRSDIREDQAGVDLYAELQIVDFNTCTPVEDLYIDFWHCNSTGVYSGVVARSNGNRADTSNRDNTFGRGLAPTDANGVVSFVTKFPGHYTGRAIHIHILGTHGGTLLPNQTYSGGSVSHVGQIFFDQDLISEVEATPVYMTNRQRLTLNRDDSIFTQSAANGFDPVMEYTLLGDSVADGIYAWISVGIDMTASIEVSAAETLTARAGITGPVSASNGSSTGPDVVGGNAGDAVEGNASAVPIPSGSSLHIGPTAVAALAILSAMLFQ
uniref:Intradiol ring-cleavage dioxygenases domain-containing protein n=1 Tax=Globisporangium ultimum (strain ATCC 200006 / CBS 805.95 / DAOM BR144) TaxID=431595 RepID=K3XB81_GLOUD